MQYVSTGTHFANLWPPEQYVSTGTHFANLWPPEQYVGTGTHCANLWPPEQYVGTGTHFANLWPPEHYVSTGTHFANFFIVRLQYIYIKQHSFQSLPMHTCPIIKLSLRDSWAVAQCQVELSSVINQEVYILVSTKYINHPQEEEGTSKTVHTVHTVQTYDHTVHTERTVATIYSRTHVCAVTITWLNSFNSLRMHLSSDFCITIYTHICQNLKRNMS